LTIADFVALIAPKSVLLLVFDPNIFDLLVKLVLFACLLDAVVFAVLVKVFGVALLYNDFFSTELLFTPIFTFPIPF
jgi:hypothetical protein